LPGFAKMESTQEVAAAYGNAIGMLALLAIPVAAGLFAVAPYFVPVVLGMKWLDAVPLMRALALNGVMLMLHSSMCAVIIARGHPERVAIANVIYVVVLLSLISVFALHFGIQGVALAALLGGIVCTPAFLWQIHRSAGVGPMVFVRAVARPVVASLVMVLTIEWTLPSFEATMTTAQMVGWLFAGIGVGAVSYVAVAAGLWMASGRPQGVEQILLGRLRGRLEAGWRGA
jgi:O-antigen/teichoic acid export membrane protein